MPVPSSDLPPPLVALAHELLDGHGGDAGKGRFRDGVGEHAVRASTATTPSAERAAEELAEEAGLLLVDLCGHLGELAGILIVAAASPELLTLLLEELAELRTLVRRIPRIFRPRMDNPLCSRDICTRQVEVRWVGCPDSWRVAR